MAGQESIALMLLIPPYKTSFSARLAVVTFSTVIRLHSMKYPVLSSFVLVPLPRPSFLFDLVRVNVSKTSRSKKESLILCIARLRRECSQWVLEGLGDGPAQTAFLS